MRSMTCPLWTWSPGRAPMKATRPPISGLIFERRRALTVPALLLVTVSSTVPRATRCTVTGTGPGRKTARRRTTPAATNPPITSSHFSHPGTCPPGRGRGGAPAGLADVAGRRPGLWTAVHARMRAAGPRGALLGARCGGAGPRGRSGGVLGNGTEMGMPEGTGDNVEHAIGLIDRFGIDC